MQGASYIYRYILAPCTYPKRYAVLFGYSKYCSQLCEQQKGELE